MFSLYFHTFSYVFWTNLLTRCHSASSLFSVVFCFRKVVLEIFSELDATKTEVPIFPTRTRSPKEAKRGGHGLGSPCLGAGPPLAAPRCGEATLAAHRRCSSAYIPFLGKTLNPEPPSMKSSAAAVIVNPSSGRF